MFKLKNFSWSTLESALDRKFVTPKSKDLVKKAADGKVKDYVEGLFKYTWFGTRDYTMLVLSLSPLVLAQKVSGKDEYMEIQEAYNHLKPSDMAALWAYLGTGKGSSIKSFLQGPKGEGYRILFYEIICAGMKESNPNVTEEKMQKEGEKVWDSFVKQCGKITSWSFVNREIVEDQLLPCLDQLNKDLAKALADALKRGLDAIPTKLGSFESVLDELREIRSDDLNGLKSFLNRFDLDKGQEKTLYDIQKASQLMLNDPAKKGVTTKAMKELSVKNSVVLVRDLAENFKKLADEKLQKDVYVIMSVSLSATESGKKLLAQHEKEFGKPTFLTQVGVELPNLLSAGVDKAGEISESVQKWWENKQPSAISRGISCVLDWLNNKLDELNGTKS